MDKESMVSMHNGLLFSHNEQQNYVVCRKMGGTGDHNFGQKKPSSKSQTLHVFAHMWNLGLK
jgi:hypothetical protein